MCIRYRRPGSTLKYAKASDILKMTVKKRNCAPHYLASVLLLKKWNGCNVKIQTARGGTIHIVLVLPEKKRCLNEGDVVSRHSMRMISFGKHFFRTLFV